MACPQVATGKGSPRVTHPAAGPPQALAEDRGVRRAGGELKPTQPATSQGLGQEHPTHLNRQGGLRELPSPLI